MERRAIEHMLTVLLDNLDNEHFKVIVKSVLDNIESYVEKTENKWDDVLIGTLCKKIKSQL